MAMKKLGGAFVSKVLHIETDPHQQEREALLKVGEEVIGNAYIEEDPTVVGWARDLVPSGADVAAYFRSLFPSASWVRRYNLHWMLGDTIAGITVGLVVVPQAMAYAALAQLSPAFGLYTSFTGAVLYWIFGTSKDIVIGTTAVGSLLVGGVVTKVAEEKPGVYAPEDVAKALSFLAGLILLFLGLARLGWLIEFIPYIPINAFVTSASITIMSTQLPVALGIKGLNTREAPAFVLVNTAKGLPRAQLDAAIGLTSIALLFVIRDICARMEIRQPSRKRMWAMLSSLRLTFTILLFTFISWLVHRELPKGTSKFRIVGKIEKGFSHAGVPKMDFHLFGLIATDLPAIVIILIVEHIAIAKSFGRIFGYQVIPSQEILAQGAANVLGPFFGGYTCTGSFGASAVLSKAGVRTPLAGLFSALVLVLALYALTPVFYYIPNAALAGLIIHATYNLITPPKSLYKYWQLSPLELMIWIVGVVLALFTSLEVSIYTTTGLSFVILFIRLARTPGKVSETAKVARIVRSASFGEQSSTASSRATAHKTRNIFLPSGEDLAHNTNIAVEPAYPGVFIYRFSENFNYVNQANNMDHLLQHILAHTRRTRSDDGVPLKDRLWSDAPLSIKARHDTAALLPCLRAIILDFSAVNIVDITSVQGLIDLRNTLDRYAAPATVEWHFAGVHNRWTRRALAVAGFGYPAIRDPEQLGNWCPAYTVATSLAGATEDDVRQRGQIKLALQSKDAERRRSTTSVLQGEGRRLSKETTRPGTDVVEQKRRTEALLGVDRPFFHVDLHDAVDAAVRDAKKADAQVRSCEVRSESVTSSSST